MQVPLVRLGHVKAVLRSLERLVAGDAGAIRERLASDLPAIELGADSGWLPAAVDLRVAAAVRGALGTRLHGFYREHFRAAFHGPLFRALMDGVILVTGPRPGVWARSIPPGWGLVFRGCGEWRVRDVGPGLVRLELAALPEEFRVAGAWLDAVAGSLSAMIDMARVEGGVELLGIEPDGTASFAFRWSEGPSRCASGGGTAGSGGARPG